MPTPRSSCERPTDPRHLRTRQAIVCAAIDLALEHHSIDAVSIDDIAARAGVSRRTVFNHVPGKLTALLIPLFEVRATYIQHVQDAPRELDARHALEHGILRTVREYEPLALAGRSEYILTHLVHNSTTSEMPDRSADDAHTGSLAAHLECRLGGADQIAVALLCGIGETILRQALRAAVTPDGPSPIEVTQHAFHLLNTLSSEH